ncbi:MAG: glycosyltransferase family 4 protein [Flavobacteriales bacterium]
MKLLILTQYFPPEVGAPQYRLMSLARHLNSAGVEVTVLTAMPNYPKGEIFPSYKRLSYHVEEMDGVRVHRASVYPTKSKSIGKRLRNYFSFVRSSYFAGRKHLERHYDYILCESPPLFLGISAWLLCKNKNAKLIFNVSDLWPESAEKLGLVTNRFFLFLARWLEAFLYRRSWLITGQTQGIVRDISRRFPHKKVHWLPNGIDEKEFVPHKQYSDWRRANQMNEKDFVLLYAGIMGYAQGLDVIIKAAALLSDRREIKFHLLGNGPEKEKLIEMKNSMHLDQVLISDVIPKEEMPAVLHASDMVIIPLKKLALFRGAIPSKIFEALAMKKPLLLGVDGEARDLFIDQGKAGFFFEPEGAEDLAEKIIWCFEHRAEVQQAGERGCSFVRKYFNRRQIAAEFYQLLE